MNLLLRFLKPLLTSLLILISLFSSGASAASSVEFDEIKDWDQFKVFIENEKEEEMRTGQSYMISGSLLILGGVIGYHNSKTPVEKLAYSVSQSLGVAGIGYGAFLHSVGSEQRNYYEAISSTQTLTLENKNELVRTYVSNWRQNRQNEKFIRIVTHSIVAAVNVYNGMREEGELRQGLLALGGVNLLAAVSITFQ